MTTLATTQHQFSDRISPAAGRRLWQARRYLGYSREKVAGELGVNPSLLREIELGIRKVNKDLLLKSSELYCRPLDWFVNDSKHDSSGIKSLHAPRPSPFSWKDWKEFCTFRHFSDTLIKSELLSDRIEKLSDVCRGEFDNEDFHQALDTYESSLRTGYVDVINAISQIGVTTILRPIEIMGAMIIQERRTGLILSDSKSMNARRLATAGAISKLISAQLQNRMDRGKYWFLLSHENQQSERIQENQVNSINILLPKYLLLHLQTRLKWTNDDLADPVNMYQASLRLGASYSATIWAYTLMGLITESDNRKLLRHNIRDVKRIILEDRVPDNIDNIDVWLLSQREEGTVIRAKADDVFVIKLLENASAGYHWKFDELEKSGFVILCDDYHIGEPGYYGGPSLRTIHAQPNQVADRYFELVETCSWKRLPTKKNALSFTYQKPVEQRTGLFEPKHRKSTI